MIMLIHNICIGLRGEGKSQSVDIAINISAAIDVDNWNLREGGYRLLKHVQITHQMFHRKGQIYALLQLT